MATCSSNVFVANSYKVGEDVAVAILDDRSIWNFKEHGLPVLAVTPVTHAGLPVAAAAVWCVVEVEQGSGLVADAEDDGAAVPSLAAVGPAQGFELFAVHRDAAMAPSSAGYV